MGGTSIQRTRRYAGSCDWAAQPAVALCSGAPAACLAIGVSCEPATQVSRRLGGCGYRPANEEVRYALGCA